MFNQLRTLALATLTLPVALSATAQSPSDSPWGLRNIRIPAPLQAWTVPEFQAEFTQHQSGHQAFWLYWSELEPDPGLITTTALDRGIDLVESVNGTPVVVFQLAHRPPVPVGGFWAMNFGQPFTGPKDLDTNATPTWPTGRPKGYSDSLYDITVTLANRLANTTSGTVYMRFHNESWDLWPLGENAVWDDNLDNYLRSYLTFRQAIEDVEASTSNTDIQFLVGHGSIPRGRIVPYQLWQIGVNQPPTREVVAQYLNAYTERNRCKIGQKYDINMPINTWAEAVKFASPETPQNKRLDAWLIRMINWTAAGYFEFTTAHQHGKPIFVDLEETYFDNAVTAAGGMPLPWLAAETAFELLDQASWNVIACPGPALDQFVAEDYSRKWLTQLSNNTIFCSPIIGGPHPQYIGLYGPMNPASATGCGTSSCEPLPPPTNCVINLCPFPSNDAFIYLSGEIGAPENVIRLKEANFAHYRFDKSTDGKFVDAIWRRSFFDDFAGTGSFVVNAPSGFNNATVKDIFGATQSTQNSVSSITLTGVGQAPRLVIWTP